MKIYLIGMPGCGKSSLGKKLAQKLNYEFIDMDSYIEKNACMFIDEIFESYGEDYFRALEKNTLDDFLKTKMWSVFNSINIYLNGELVLSGVDVYTVSLNSKYDIYKSYVVITAQENFSELSIYLSF